MNAESLTEEQKKKIEENKKKALAKRALKLSPKINNVYGCNKEGLPSKSINTGNIRKASVAPVYVSENKKSEVHTFVDDKHRLLQFVSRPVTNVSNEPVRQKWCHSNTNLKSKTTSANSKPSLSANINNHLFDGKFDQSLKGHCALISNDRFEVHIRFNAPFIDFCKHLETKCYDPKTRKWSFHLKEYDKFMKGATAFQPDIQIEGLPRTVFEVFHPSAQKDKQLEINLENVDEKLLDTLMPFQKAGVDFGINHNGRLLLADDMGLGKTLQAICIACYYRIEWPLLIVCPSSVRYDWAKQICHWLPSVNPQEVNVVDSGKVDPTSGDVNILSYDMLSRHGVELKKKKFQIIIMDESHFLKNSKAVRTKAAMPLLRLAKRVILLSGTPALSRPIELFSQITAVCPDLFKFHDFGLRYCAAKQQPWGWDYSGSSNMTELQLLLEKKVLIRRQKKDVLSELPAKTRQMVILSPKSIVFHKSLKQAFKIMDNRKLKGMEKRGALLQYFHETCRAKMPAVRGYIKDAVESDNKILIFAHHREMLDCIEDFVKTETSSMEYIRIDGKTTSEHRSFLCKKFQSSESHKLAILSITAANAGLNLSAANQVIFAELFWNPGILVQAEDRAHRIGQKDSVSVQYLVASHTADDFLWPLIQAKLSVLSKAGLTKDNFSETDTMRLADREQRHILDMFQSSLIDDLVPTVGAESLVANDDPCTADSSSTHSAQKRQHCGNQFSDNLSQHQNSVGVGRMTTKCQQYTIDNFFSSPPPTKVQKITEFAADSVASGQMHLHHDGQSCCITKCQMCSVFTNSDSEGCDREKNGLSSEDLSTLIEFDWDDGF